MCLLRAGPSLWLRHYEFLVNIKPVEEERSKLDPKQTKRIKKKRKEEREEKDDNNQTNTPIQYLMCIKQ